MAKAGRRKKRKELVHALPIHQLAATVAPDRSTSDLLGNFGDLERLFEQLGEAPVYELGKPLPGSKYVPRSRVGDCPASHNRALLGDKLR